MSANDDGLRAFHSLVEIWNEIDEARDGSWCGDVARSLARYMEHGADNREYLYNVANWDLKRLQMADYWSRLRKPRIDLRVSVETGGALSLEWAPRTERLRVSSMTRSPISDFLRFDSGRLAGWDFPANRLMHVPRLGSLVNASAARMRFPVRCAHACFHAAAALVESNASALTASFDVRFLSKLVVADKRPPDGDLKGCLAEIVDLAARDKTAAEERLSSWSQRTLKPYAIDLRDFVRLARDCGGDVDKLTDGLRELTTRSLSVRRVRQWLCEFDDLVDTAARD